MGLLAVVVLGYAPEHGDGRLPLGEVGVEVGEGDHELRGDSMLAEVGEGGNVGGAPAPGDLERAQEGRNLPVGMT